MTKNTASVLLAEIENFLDVKHTSLFLQSVNCNAKGFYMIVRGFENSFA